MATGSFEGQRSEAQWTQALFREINDHVAELSQHWDNSPPRFICECLRIDCGATIMLSLTEYGQVRSDPARFIVFPGHEDAESQDVVERRGDCLFVRNIASTTLQLPPENGRSTESRLSR